MRLLETLEFLKNDTDEAKKEGKQAAEDFKIF